MINVRQEKKKKESFDRKTGKDYEPKHVHSYTTLMQPRRDKASAHSSSI